MTLSLFMIVKNEEDVICRALENARAFADEIIIVDTGSSDGTRDKAQALADRVYSFDWTDDFSAARNYAVSKTTCDYWMWLDADDIVPPESARGIARLMRSVDPAVDVVMLPYVLERDPSGKPVFSYYRERIVKNRPDYFWRGRVHEAVGLHGKIKRAQYEIVHAKPRGRESGTRNLEIYKKMLKEGAALDPREKYYFARELFRNGEVRAAADTFADFLSEPDGFYVNKIDACIMLSRCYRRLGEDSRAYSPLFESFRYGLPTGEACCEIGLLLLAESDYSRAAYWFGLATKSKPDLESGAFVNADYYGFLPHVWLTVCYDRLGKLGAAYRHHCRARKLRPDHPSVIANQAYFESLGY